MLVPMASPTGLEPVTPNLEGSCSILMSYGLFDCGFYVEVRLPEWSRRANKRANGTLPVGSRKMVGAAGFELATLCSQSRCATRLRYAPTASILT